MTTPWRRLRPRSALIALGVVVVLVLVAWGGVRWWQQAHRTTLQRAVGLAPAATKRLSFTDWARVRDAVKVHGTSAADVRRLVDRSYDADLSSVSTIADSAAALQKDYGFSPASIDWESYAQSSQGAAMVVHLPGSISFDALHDKLAKLGYGVPKSATGVWKGGADLVAEIDSSLTPEMQYVVLLAHQHLVVTSDTASYAATAAAVAQGHGASLAGVAHTRDLAGTVGDAAAAMLWSRDFACSDLAMSQADTSDQGEAERLVDQAGGVTPMTGLVMAMAPDRTFRVAEQFEDSSAAHDNLRPRASLAVGDAVGRGQSFPDIAKLTGSRTEGRVVLLTFRPPGKTGYVLSALDDGPVLFATC